MKDYGRRLILDQPFERALAMTVQALQNEGFETIARVDVRETFRTKLGEDFRRYVVLSVCNPRLALRALKQDLDAGTILGVSVAVYELADGETAVTVGEPFAPLVTDRLWRLECRELTDVAMDAEDRLARVLQRLSHQTAMTVGC